MIEAVWKGPQYKAAGAFSRESTSWQQSNANLSWKPEAKISIFDPGGITAGSSEPCQLSYQFCQLSYQFWYILSVICHISFASQPGCKNCRNNVMMLMAALLPTFWSPIIRSNIFVILIP